MLADQGKRKFDLIFFFFYFFGLDSVFKILQFIVICFILSIIYITSNLFLTCRFCFLPF